MSGPHSGGGHHFFKVLKVDFSERLRIPPAFMKHIVMGESKLATLKGPGGRIFHVRLHKKVSGTYIQDGWPKFVKGHSLKDSDFLLFRYDDNGHFTVRIFDKTACEREDVTNCNTREKSNFYSGRKRSRSSKKTCLDFRHHSQRKSCGSETSNQQSDDAHSPQSSECNGIDSTQRYHMRTPKIIRSENIKKENADTSISKANSSKKICHILEGQTLKIKAMEKAFTFSKASRFPSCLLVMKKASVDRGFLMSFPCCFTRAHLPRSKQKFFLLDPTGKEWEVTYIPYSCGRSCLSGGWGAFARGNNLEVGDICIFEVVGDCQIQVHIFR